ncbi:MAG: mechanosensitive ion channel domain-containing protein [Planctomycetota bacterium]
MLQALLLALPLAFATAPQDVEPPDRAKVEARIEALVDTKDEAEQKELSTLRVTIEQLDRREALDGERAKFEAEIEGKDEAVAAQRTRLERTLEADAAVVEATRDLDSLDLEALEARPQAAPDEASAARAADEETDREIEARRTRATRVPAERSAAETALDERLERLAALDAGTGATAASRLLRAEILALRAELGALEAEGPADDARLAVLDVQRQVTSRRLASARAVAEALRVAVTARREEAADEEAEAVRLENERLREKLPWLESALARNVELLDLRRGDEGLTQRRDEVLGNIDETRILSKEVRQRELSMRRRLEAGGLTEGLGRTLRRDDRWLKTPEELSKLRRTAALVQSDAELLQLELEEEADGLDLMRGRLTEEAERTAIGSLTDEDRERVRKVFEDRRAYIQLAIDDCKAIASSSVTLVQELDKLVGHSTRYREAIQQRILWVRSARANPLKAFADLSDHVIEVDAEIVAADPLGDANKSFEKRPLAPSALFVAGIALLVLRRRIRRKIQSYAPLVRSFRTDEFAHTVRVMGLTLLLAVPLPLLMLGAAQLLEGGDDDVTQAMGGALRGVAEFLVALLLAREAFLADGLGPAHYRWNERRCALLRRDLTAYSTAMAVLATVYFFLDRLDNPVGLDSIGRLVFLVGMVLVTSLTLRIRKHIGDTSIPGSQQESLDRRVRFWLRVLAWLPIGLGLLALVGFIYTAGTLEERLQFSYVLALVLLLTHATLQRWRFVLRRRLALEQARERARARAAAAAEGDDAASDAVEESDIDIPAVDAQTRQLFRSGIALGLLVGLFLIWSSVFPALKGLDRIQILPYPKVLEENSGTANVGAGSRDAEVARAADASEASGGEATTMPPMAPGMAPLPAQASPGSDGGGTSTLTLADLMVAILATLVTTVLARNVPGLLELSLLRRLPLDAGARYAATTITRYLLLMVGGSIVLSALGLGWSKIQWLAAALTFGLAFGLQEIFANFVSGLIILIERPVRVGDIVTVDGTDGRITRLQMRATTLQDWDRREFLIPNKHFITSTVINWTLSDPISRRIVHVGVAYGTDMKSARETLLDIANRHPNVLEEPAPHVVFRSFGESSLDLDLRMFVSNADSWPVILDDLHSSIDAAFREKAIEIAFPQRDLHVRTFDRSAAEGSNGGRTERSADAAT